MNIYISWYGNNNAVKQCSREDVEGMGHNYFLISHRCVLKILEYQAVLATCRLQMTKPDNTKRMKAYHRLSFKLSKMFACFHGPDSVKQVRGEVTVGGI